MKRITGKAERLAVRALSIPADARLVPGPNGGAAYTYEVGGKPCAMAFYGTSARPAWRFRFASVERRAAQIAEFHAALVAIAKRKTEQKTERAAWVNPLQVGEILYTSWGYDQTNVEFYAVTKVSGRRVWVREIAADYESTGFMSGKTWPAMPIRFIGDETMHTAQPSGPDGAYVKISDCQTAHRETGRDHHTSSYA